MIRYYIQKSNNIVLLEEHQHLRHPILRLSSCGDIVRPFRQAIHGPQSELAFQDGMMI